MAETALSGDPLLASAPEVEGYRVLGGVVLYQKLGQGGMGAVYRGKHLRLEVDVALKIMVPPSSLAPTHADNYVARFLREAKTAAAVRHQNLIRVYDVNSESGVHYLIMDFVDGESAGDRLKRKGKLGEAEAVEICLGAAEGLAEAHREGIVHRDIKPDNILIDKRGRVVVADLGLAKAYSSGTGEGTSAMSMGLSMSQQAMGTPYYMSPEQTMSAKDAGPAADVWSLGVTLYQLATGKLPYADTDLLELMMKIRKEPPIDPKAACSGVSDGLCAILSRCLEKAPGARYADCSEMAKALRAHLTMLKGDVEGGLADPAAGSTKLALVSVTPPPSKTLTIIGRSMLDSGSKAPKTDSGRVAASEGRIRRGRRAPAASRGAAGMVLVGLLVAALVGGGLAAWYFAAGPGSEGDRVGGAMMPRPGEGEAPAEPHAAIQTAADLEAERRKGEAEAKVASIFQTARSFRDAGLLEKARDKASEALEIVPDHAETKRFLADVSAAIAAKQSASERVAEHRKWLDEGLRLRLAGKLREAATAYERAQASAPAGNAEAATAAAECLAEDLKTRAIEAEAAGDLDKAVELYAEAVAKRETPDVRRALAEAKRKLDERRAEETRRAEAARWRTRAEDAERAGDAAAALGYYREAANRGADVTGRIAQLQREVAQREAAAQRQAAYEAAIARGRSFAGRGQWKDAASAYEQALVQKAGDAEATRLLAEANRHLGAAPTLSLDCGGGVTMELIYVKPGRFTMGSPASEAGRDNDEAQHNVTITRGFYLGRYEVTQAQYQAVMGANPSKWKEPNRPVEQVMWNEATEFCNRLSQRAGKQVRLPTEAEWEYACRAGSTTRFCFGDSDGGLGEYAWFSGNSGHQTHAVGGRKPNAWGLHDMHGNVWEWCADWYGNYGGDATDPTGPASGGGRVLRGGSWYRSAQDCRSAFRNRLHPAYRDYGFGFRVAVSAVAPGR
ncbi:MAG TPA: SUMF1/EgtB/PvdO family nonheme iron enzyme [Thermoleophilia bacterium]|nr:SUMF1/EgtB/PvdO family nonheme iron enzyme [Thermoleophilia bacterium]